jgi:L-threonylcarbamoyladenylate synthase
LLDRFLPRSKDTRRDVGEGKVFGRAAGALLPVEKQLAVAIGQAGGGVDAKHGHGAVDPVGRAFQFGIGADGGLVEDQMRGGVGSGVEDGIFGAVLLIEEGGSIAKLGEDLGEGMRVGDGGLGLDADLVAGGVGIAGVVDALVGEGVNAAVLAKAEDLAFCAQITRGRVEESVVLEGPRCFKVEAKARKAGLKNLWIGDGELQFNLGCLHGRSIRRVHTLAAIGWRDRRDRKDMFGGKTEQLSGHAGLLRAADLLRNGGTVAFPTETVYGLGANALDAAAVAKIFEAKERPGWDPVIVHVCDREMLKRVAEISPALTAKTEALMAAFWPGPLTLLLPRTVSVPDSVTAGRPLVGVRMPAHPLALELIKRAGVPVAAPSANRFGRISPTTAAHVLADLEGRIDAVLDAGATTVGVESTVLDVEAMTIYRPGAITAEMIAAVAGDVRMFQESESTASAAPESLPSPGVGLRHYAPRAKLVLVEVPPDGDPRQTLLPAIDSLHRPGSEIGLMLPDGWDASYAGQVFRWGPWDDKAVLARRLFAGMRTLDEAGATVILCPLPDSDGVGLALRDRLQKAARKK